MPGLRHDGATPVLERSSAVVSGCGVSFCHHAAPSSENLRTREPLRSWKDDMPKVSVIVPVHNASAHLRECLDGILGQSLTDIEVLCIDDGSTDDSPHILEDYARRDGRLLILEQENAGAGAARNAGLAVAQGDYLSFLDADDFFEPTMLEEAYNACREVDADVCVYRGRRFNVGDERFTPADWLLRMDLVPGTIPFSYRDMPDHILYFVSPAPWTKMFRRAFVAEKALRFQEIARTNDLLFTYLALVKADRITVVNKVLVNYRVGSDSNLQATNDKAPLEFYEALLALRSELTECGVFEEVERSFVNTALSICLHNLHSLRTPDSFGVLYQRLRDEYFRELGVVGHDREYFFVEHQYEQYVEIEGKSADAYLLDELRFHRSELQDARRRLRSMRAQLAKSKSQLRKVRESRSYRIGQLITAVPRRIKRLSSRFGKTR